MADVITRFKLETTQYDSKLRDAAKGLREFTHQAQLGGKNFTDFSQKAVESARSLGTVASGATNTKEKVRDLVGAYNEAARAYNSLSEAQQQHDFGKNLAASLETLKNRIAEAKQELYGLNDAMSKTGGDGMLAGLKGKMGGAVQVFAGNIMTQAANGIQETISQSIQLAQAAEGIEAAFNRLNRPDLLNQLKEATHGTVSEIELMKAAVKFDDFKLPVEELGTMLAFAQKKAKDTGQSVDYMVDSIVTGLGRKSLMILDNLGLSASEIKERMAETGDMTTAVGAIIRDQMAAAGGYVETAADRAARATADQQNAMRRLGKELMPIAGMAANVFSAIRIAITSTIGVVVKYHGVILAASAGMGAYAVVVNRATIATKAHAAATKVAEAAQKAFNLAQKASPIGLVVGGLTAAAVAIATYSGKSSEAAQRENDERQVRIQQMERERAERDRLAQKAKNEADVISTTAGEKVAKYKLLQEQWSKLQTEQQKNTFIRDNANLFNELGLSISSSADAMKAFVTNSAKVIEALNAMAKAEALKDLLKDAYKRQYEGQANGPERGAYKVSTAEMRLLSPSNMTTSRGTTQADIDAYINSFISSQPELVNAGVTLKDYKYNATDATMSGGQYEFHMNASGLKKLEDFRKSNAIKNMADEANADVERLQSAYNEAVLSAENLKAGSGAFSPSITNAKSGRGTTNTKELTREEQIQKSINKLVDESVDATDERRKKIREEVGELQKQLDVIKKRKDYVLGKDQGTTVTGTSIQTSSGMTVYIQGLKKQLSEANFGSDIYQSLSNSLADTSMLQSLVGESLSVGLGTAMFDVADELGRDFWTRAMEGGVENVDWDAILAKINEKRKELDLGELTADYKKGTTSSKSKENKDDKKEVKLSDAIGQIGSGLSGITNGMEQLGVEIPQGLQNVVNGIQTVTSILTGIASIVSAIQAISTANLLKFMAGGGIVGRAAGGMYIPGNSFSGDRLRMPVVGGGMIGVNSGELILNRAQQGVLADALQGGAQQAPFGQPYVDGEKIFLGMNNTSKRMGRGEIVTTSTLRRLGLI